VLIVLKSGRLKLLEPSGPVYACNGNALPFALRKPVVVPFVHDKLHREWPGIEQNKLSKPWHSPQYLPYDNNVIAEL
jgi:hypothetical protein